MNTAELLRKLSTASMMAASLLLPVARVQSAPLAAPALQAPYRREEDKAKISKLVLEPSPNASVTVEAAHSSHSSHRSHSSHSSHYSGSGTPYTAPATPSTPYYSPNSSATPQPPASSSSAFLPSYSQNALTTEQLLKLAKHKELFPIEVKVVRQTSFLIFDNDTLIGGATLAAGTIVKATGIRGDRITTQFGEKLGEIPVRDTDLGQKIDIQKIMRLPDPTEIKKSSSESAPLKHLPVSTS